MIYAVKKTFNLIDKYRNCIELSAVAYIHLQVTALFDYLNGYARYRCPFAKLRSFEIVLLNVVGIEL